MQKFLKLTIANPLAVILLVMIAVWGGAFALLHLPVGLFPGLDVPVVNVITHYPGAAAEDVELLVTRPIEDRIRAISGVRRVASTSIEGVSQVTAEFDWGLRLTDARQLIQAELAPLQRELPGDVRPRLENIGTTLQEVAGYVVSGGGNPSELRTTVRSTLVSRLMSVAGVAHVEVLGGDEPAYIVQLRPEALSRHHLTLSAVSAALSRYNQVAATDFIERGAREYFIRGDSRLQTAADILAVPVVADGVNSIFLRDIARVKSGRVPRHYRVHGNGLPAVAFLVSKQTQASTIGVVQGVDRELQSLKSLLPPGAKIRKFYDQADIVSEARDALFHDLILGALLAVAVLFFFMGPLRATLIVTATIPITLLATLAVMQLFGQTLNVITLSALTLAVGMVVDDAIVVAESVMRHLQSGAGRQAASLAGAAEIAGPDISGTLTTVAAFAPLLFLGGIAGLFVRPFGLVVSVALLASLVVSLTLVPMLFGQIDCVGRHRALGSRLLDGLDRGLQKTLRCAFAHRGLVLLLGGLSLGLGGLAAWLGPVSVLPPIDEGAILIEYVMPPGTSLSESDRVGNILEQQALAQPDVETVYRRTGSPEGGFQIEGVNRGELTLKLSPRKVRSRTVAQIIARLRSAYAQIPGVAFLYHQPTQEKMDESLSGLPALFGVTIYGRDNNRLVTLAGQAEEIMAKDSALANIINNTKIKSPQIIFRPDPLELARYGLAPGDVFATIQASRSGLLATTILRQRQQVQVLLKNDAPPDMTLDLLEGLAINTAKGPVPLRQLAKVEMTHLPAAVTRLNGQREVTLLAEVDGSIPAAVERLRQKFSAISLPEGYSITFTGQYQVLTQTIRDFLLVGLAAMMLVYLILTMQFHSWRQPLIILVTIPVALVGAIVLLAITQVGLDVSVGMGVLTLVGIAVNNAIVLLDYTNRQVAAGQDLTDALLAAASVRLRPILMTATTTICALIPVALNPAVGSRIFQPFAITVIGGLLSATFATLILVPVLRTFRQQGE
ncbi:efflux RND transporter permease subunit [Geopsychrobacter electrodiphilus]|uniref:efflux RND transporter permease subunit n=1 Tax=Geopsychrobacter electrodiphilus TaxID=225196 RepID=UPI00035E528F|nr:efflux RND transporter permease subunit [Geopsychrobacter electrodiphilus]